MNRKLLVASILSLALPFAAMAQTSGADSSASTTSQTSVKTEKAPKAAKGTKRVKKAKVQPRSAKGVRSSGAKAGSKSSAAQKPAPRASTVR